MAFVLTVKYHENISENTLAKIEKSKTRIRIMSSAGIVLVSNLTSEMSHDELIERAIKCEMVLKLKSQFASFTVYSRYTVQLK